MVSARALRLRSTIARRLWMKKLLEFDELLKHSTFSLINGATSPILTSLYVFLLRLSSVIYGMVFVFFLAHRDQYSASLHDT